MNNNNFDIARFGISIDEARKQLGIGRNLMLKLVTVPGFLASSILIPNLAISK